MVKFDRAILPKREASSPHRDSSKLFKRADDDPKTPTYRSSFFARSIFAFTSNGLGMPPPVVRSII